MVTFYIQDEFGPYILEDTLFKAGTRLPKAPKVNLGSVGGVKVVALGPKGGKILGWDSKGKPIYASSTQGQVLIQLEKAKNKAKEIKTWLMSLQFSGSAFNVEKDTVAITEEEGKLLGKAFGVKGKKSGNALVFKISELSKFVGQPLVPKEEKVAGAAAKEAAGDGDLFPDLSDPASFEWLEPGTSEFKKIIKGGSHTDTLKALKDKNGKYWVFKTNNDTISRAEEAALRLQRLIVGDLVPAAKYMKAGKKAGVLIEWRPGDLLGAESAHGVTPAKTKKFAREMAMHQVADWLTSQFDGHGGNFLVQGDHLIGFDKGQAWKFLGKDKLDPDWVPNNSPTIYKQLWDMVENGTVPLNDVVQGFAAAIANAEQITDEQYKLIAAPYVGAFAEWATHQGVEPSEVDNQAKLNKMAKRLSTLKKDFEKLIEKKTGVKTKIPVPGEDNFETMPDVKVQTPFGKPAEKEIKVAPKTETDDPPKVEAPPKPVIPMALAGWPKSTKNGKVTVHHPGKEPPAIWPKGYPGPGFKATMLYSTFTKGVIGGKKEKGTYVVEFAVGGDGKITVGMQYPDGTVKTFDSPGKASDSMKLFAEGLPLDMNATEKKAKGIAYPASKAFGIKELKDDLKAALTPGEPVPEEVQTVKELEESGKVTPEQKATGSTFLLPGKAITTSDLAGMGPGDVWSWNNKAGAKVTLTKTDKGWVTVNDDTGSIITYPYTGGVLDALDYVSVVNIKKATAEDKATATPSPDNWETMPDVKGKDEYQKLLDSYPPGTKVQYTFLWTNKPSETVTATKDANGTWMEVTSGAPGKPPIPADLATDLDVAISSDLKVSLPSGAAPTQDPSAPDWESIPKSWKKLDIENALKGASTGAEIQLGEGYEYIKSPNGSWASKDTGAMVTFTTLVSAIHNFIGAGFDAKLKAPPVSSTPSEDNWETFVPGSKKLTIAAKLKAAPIGTQIKMKLLGEETTYTKTNSSTWVGTLADELYHLELAGNISTALKTGTTNLLVKWGDGEATPPPEEPKTIAIGPAMLEPGKKTTFDAALDQASLDSMPIGTYMSYVKKDTGTAFEFAKVNATQWYDEKQDMTFDSDFLALAVPKTFDTDLGIDIMKPGKPESITPPYFDDDKSVATQWLNQQDVGAVVEFTTDNDLQFKVVKQSDGKWKADKGAEYTTETLTASSLGGILAYNYTPKAKVNPSEDNWETMPKVEFTEAVDLYAKLPEGTKIKLTYVDGSSRDLVKLGPGKSGWKILSTDFELTNTQAMQGVSKDIVTKVEKLVSGEALPPGAKWATIQNKKMSEVFSLLESEDPGAKLKILHEGEHQSTWTKQPDGTWTGGAPGQVVVDEISASALVVQSDTDPNLVDPDWTYQTLYVPEAKPSMTPTDLPAGEADKKSGWKKVQKTINKTLLDAYPDGTQIKYSYTMSSGPVNFLVTKKGDSWYEGKAKDIGGDYIGDLIGSIALSVDLKDAIPDSVMVNTDAGVTASTEGPTYKWEALPPHASELMLNTFPDGTQIEYSNLSSYILGEAPFLLTKKDGQWYQTPKDKYTPGSPGTPIKPDMIVQNLLNSDVSSNKYKLPDGFTGEEPETPKQGVQNQWQTLPTPVAQQELEAYPDGTEIFYVWNTKEFSVEKKDGVWHETDEDGDILTPSAASLSADLNSALTTEVKVKAPGEPTVATGATSAPNWETMPDIDNKEDMEGVLEAYEDGTKIQYTMKFSGGDKSYEAEKKGGDWYEKNLALPDVTPTLTVQLAGDLTYSKTANKKVLSPGGTTPTATKGYWEPLTPTTEFEMEGLLNSYPVGTKIQYTYKWTGKPAEVFEVEKTKMGWYEKSISNPGDAPELNNNIVSDLINPSSVDKQVFTTSPDNFETMPESIKAVSIKESIETSDFAKTHSAFKVKPAKKKGYTNIILNDKDPTAQKEFIEFLDALNLGDLALQKSGKPKGNKWGSYLTVPTEALNTIVKVPVSQGAQPVVALTEEAKAKIAEAKKKAEEQKALVEAQQKKAKELTEWGTNHPPVTDPKHTHVLSHLQAKLNLEMYARESDGKLLLGADATDFDQQLESLGLKSGIDFKLASTPLDVQLYEVNFDALQKSLPEAGTMEGPDGKTYPKGTKFQKKKTITKVDAAIKSEPGFHKIKAHTSDPNISVVKFKHVSSEEAVSTLEKLGINWVGKDGVKNGPPVDKEGTPNLVVFVNNDQLEKEASSEIIVVPKKPKQPPAFNAKPIPGMGASYAGWSKPHTPSVIPALPGMNLGRASQSIAMGKAGIFRDFQVRARRVKTKEGKVVTEISGTLANTPTFSGKFSSASMGFHAANNDPAFHVNGAPMKDKYGSNILTQKYDEATGLVIESGPNEGMAIEHTGKKATVGSGTTVEVHGGPMVFKNVFRIRVEDGNDMNAELTQAFAELGIDPEEAMSAHDADTERIWKKWSIVRGELGKSGWKQELDEDPSIYQEAWLDGKLKELESSVPDIQLLVQTAEIHEVAPGHSTVVVKDGKKFADAGWKGAYRVDNDWQSLYFQLSQGIGWMSRKHALMNGNAATGWSPGDDVKTGGADSNFFRVWKGGNPGNNGIIVHPRAFSRMDHRHYSGDAFSNITGQHIGMGHTSYPHSNTTPGTEITWNGGTAISDVMCVVCSEKKKLIARLNKDGITEVNGVPLEDFIIDDIYNVEAKIHPDLKPSDTWWEE